MSENTSPRVWTEREPVFTLKAKDNLTLDTIARYRELCEEHGLSGQAAEVAKAYEEIRDWRRDHPDRMKMPDHEHVPAALGSHGRSPS